MRRISPLAAVAAAFLLVSPAGADAQGYFGQNQVQYDTFDWRVLETEHFLIHYYPEEEQATRVAAQLAERAYGRMSRLLDHQFRERKPLVFFASRSDFGQNNVTGDLGEFTGGVTEALRHRILMPFTGDFGYFDQILTHEMVHEFQYDIFARGKAGGGLQTLAQVAPPLWFMEGMATYLSTGQDQADIAMVMRDAALNGRLPTIEEMTMRPDRWNPYSFGAALWAYIGERWGDEAIGRILQAAPSVGIERAFKRELGVSLEDLGDEWKDAMQTKHLPQIAELDRVRTFAQPLLTERRTKGQVFLAPSLSNDGRYIAFLSNGSFLRGEVFIDLWLGDAQTGKRLKRLVKSALDPDFEELRIMYSQSAFSPDGRSLAFTAQRAGKDVLYILDVQRRRRTKRLDLPLEGVTGPTWSPDGKRLVFSGNDGGITDLYMIDADGKNFHRLTDDPWGDLQPAWSPDGKKIAFASDRGPQSSLDVLRFGKWQVSVLDLERGTVEVLPGQRGHNLNPQWSPDGEAIAFVSDRTGIPNVFLFESGEGEHYQLTDVVGGVTGPTPFSPAITWATGADRLAFTYFEDGEYTVWSVSDPRRLKKQPYRDPLPETTPLIADAATPAAAAPAAERSNGAAPADTATAATSGLALHQSYYRSPDDEFRLSGALSTDAEAGEERTVTVSALLDSAALALPDTARFKEYAYKVRFQPDYVARPTIGYAQDNFGRGVFGGTAIILSDMLGNHRLAFAGQVNGRFSEAQLFAQYANLSRRFQYAGGALQNPFYFLSGDAIYEADPGSGDGVYIQEQNITRYIVRQAFATGIYPFNRFQRVEVGGRFTNIDQTTMYIRRAFNPYAGLSTLWRIDSLKNQPGLNYVSPFVAYVSDNALFGYTGPIFGHRLRAQIEPTIGSFHWVEYTLDYRRYDPILFNFLTVATRFMAVAAIGPDEMAFPKYIGRPEFVRGYDRESIYSPGCAGLPGATYGCSVTQLLGSRVAVFNAELRFPLVRRFELGLLPIALPPVDGLFFFDAGAAWSRQQTVSLKRPEEYDPNVDRYPLRSYGFGIRLNLFNYAILRWDYAIPLDSPSKDGFWTWSIGPSF